MESYKKVYLGHLVRLARMANMACEEIRVGMEILDPWDLLEIQDQEDPLEEAGKVLLVQ